MSLEGRRLSTSRCALSTCGDVGGARWEVIGFFLTECVGQNSPLRFLVILYVNYLIRDRGGAPPWPGTPPPSALGASMLT